MPNLLTRLFRREPEITRYTVNDYINWLTSGRYGLTQPYGMPVSYARGKPAERIENSYEGYTYGGFKANPIVFGTMTARSSVFSEARFMWRRIEDGRPGDLFSDDALDVLRRPWPNGTTGELLSRMIQDVDLAGNCYLVNEGDRLRRLRPDWVQIVLTGDPRTDPDVDVFGYVYTPGGPDSGDGRSYMPDEVCHWSPIPDPDALYRGMSWLTPVVREIQGDSAAVDHKIAFFRNGATLGPIVKVPAGMTAAQFKEFVAAADAAHVGVENAYKPMYVGGGADVTLQAATMQQLDFKALQGASETRICVAARVPAVIAGVSEGLAGSSLNAGNYGTAKRSFADGCLRPMWRSACAALMAIIQVPEGAELWYDERDIAFLRDDEQDIAQIQQIQAATISSYYTGGWVPETARDAVVANDLTKLKHTGVPSVQVQEAASADADYDGVADAEAEAGEDYEAALDEFRSELAEWEDEISRAIDAGELDEDEIERRDYYDVRDFRGRFRKMSDRVGHALNEWLKGDGEADDPLEEFSRENLRLAAKEFGITPRRGASSDELKLALLKDARARFRGESNADAKPSHRLTLSSPTYRDQDVGVYHDGGKVSLYRESSSGQRGSKVVTVASLAELEQWGRDNGEPQVAEWAASERGAAAVKKAVPRKAPAKKAAPVATPEPIREIEVENAIRQAYRDAIAAQPPSSNGRAARNGDRVPLADVRNALGEQFSRNEVDAALTRLGRDGNLQQEENQQNLTSADRAAEVRLGARKYHFLLLDDPSDRPAAPPAKAAPRKAAKSVPAKATPKPKREPLGGDARPNLRTKAGRQAVIVAAVDAALAGTEGNTSLDFRLGRNNGSNREILLGLRDEAAAGTFDDLDMFRDALGRLAVRLGADVDARPDADESMREHLRNKASAREALARAEAVLDAARDGRPLPAAAGRESTFNFTANGLSAAARPSAPDVDGVERVEGEIRDGSGAVVGSFRYHLDPSTHTAHMDSIGIAPEHGGKGFTSSFVGHVEDQLKAQGFTHFTVDAAFGGGLFWARRGYDWNADRAMAFGDVPARMAQRLADHPSDPDSRRLREWLDRFDGDRAGWPSPQEIADAGPLGESVLDGSSWRGEKRLSMSPAKSSPRSRRQPLGDPAAKIASLRALGDVEAVRDDLDLHTVAELKILAGEVGVATSGRKRDVVDRITAKLGTPDAPDPEQSARDRQATLDTARTAAEALVDLDTMAHNGGSEKALRQRVDTRVRMGALTEDEGARLRDLADNPAGFRAAVADVLSSRGATTHHTVGDTVPFDPSTMRHQGDRPAPGTPVQVVSPGASMVDDGGVVTLVPTVVMEIDESRRSLTPTEEDEVARAGDDEDGELLRAMAVDGDEFEAYWTRGKGLARWSTKPHPWRTLRRLLRKHPGIRDAEGLASHYFHIVFGIWPGERKGDNPVGPG